MAAAVEMPTDANPVVVHNGDCLDVLRALPDGCVDAVITDPPYGLGFAYDGYEDTRENLESLIAEFVPEARRVARRVFVTPGQSQVGLYPPADWVLAVTWDTTGTFGRFGYSQWMPVLAYGEDLEGFGRVNGVTKADRIHVRGGAGAGFMRGKEKECHPCPKPQNVMRLLIKRLTAPGDLILDPFAGSGTTGVAAMIDGRRAILVERSAAYCVIARRRIDHASGTAAGSLFAEVTA